MTREDWKDITGYEGFFQISNLGRIKSMARERKHSITGKPYLTKEKLLNSSFDNKGYKVISLSKNGQRKTFKVHRLVGLHFIVNHGNKPLINHKDGIKDNNNVWNLEWCNQSENSFHAHNMGLIKMRKGEKGINNKSVCQYDKNTGQFLGQYYSGKNAMDSTNIQRNNIYAACKGLKKSAGGFLWAYTKKENYYGKL